MITFKQEKTLAIFTTMLALMSIYFAKDIDDIVIFQDGAYIIYGLGLGLMWNNIRIKSKEEKNKIDTY